MMKKESLIKIILITFFLIFFSFLFWYFYKPTAEGDFVDKIKNDISFFPFGNNNTNNFNNDSLTNSSDNKISNNFTEEKKEIPRLRQISQEPTAGIYFDLLNEEEIVKYNRQRNRNNQIDINNNVSEIRYILSKNGHIFNTFTDSLKEKRISNVTIPKIYEIFFIDKNNFMIRYLNQSNNIKTYSVVLAEKTPEELEIEKEQKKDGEIDKNIRNFDGVFFPNDLLKIAISSYKNKIFYLKEEQSKNTIVGIIANNLAGEKEEIFNFDFKEWNIQWVVPNKILFTSTPSKNTYSISMILDLENKTFRRVSKPLLAGNTLANHDLSKILYSGIYNNKFTLLIYDQETNSRKPLPFSTVVDKCVWSQNNIDVYCAVPKTNLGLDQPDAWYRGYEYFTDNIYKINTEFGFSDLVYLNSAEEPKFDVTELKLDESENYLYWIDKRTDYAWSYLINEPVVIEDEAEKEIKEDVEKEVDTEEEVNTKEN